VAEHLAEFVDHGLSHVVVTNLALMGGGSGGGVSALKGSLIEQRKLTRLLKTMRPRNLRGESGP
jgi:hypothetical protein